MRRVAVVDDIERLLCEMDNDTNYLTYTKEAVHQLEIINHLDPLIEYGLTKKERNAVIIPVRDSKTNPKINRNSPCHCGSGIKYKKCCLTK